MNSKLGITIVITVFIVTVSLLYTVSRLYPIVDQFPQEQGNQNPSVVVDDTTGDITSDLSKVTDDSAATVELNTLEEQANNF